MVNIDMKKCSALLVFKENKNKARLWFVLIKLAGTLKIIISNVEATGK